MAVEFRSNLDVILFILSPPTNFPEPITAWNTRRKTSDRSFCSNVIFADALCPRVTSTFRTSVFRPIDLRSHRVMVGWGPATSRHCQRGLT